MRVSKRSTRALVLALAACLSWGWLTGTVEGARSQPPTSATSSSLLEQEQLDEQLISIQRQQHPPHSASGDGGDGDGGSGGSSGTDARALRDFGVRHDILVWQMRLDPSQCTSYAASPCYNIYAVNSTNGELLWFAYR
jgi:hypothetical protein